MNFRRYHVSKNLLPFSNKTFTITINSTNLTVTCSNGNLYFSGTVVSEISSGYSAWKTNFAFDLEAGTYYCNNPSPLGAGFGRYIKKYSDDTTILGATDYTFTLSETTKCYLSFYISKRNLDTQIKLMLNLGSTPQPYEPYSSEVWHDIPYYQHKTATDTLTLPATLYPNDTSITVGLKGNEEHTGTPTPTSPVDVVGVGERTGNLYDYSTIVPGYIYDSDDGQMILYPDKDNRWKFAAVPLIEVESGATYLRTYNLLPWGNFINFYDSNKNFLEQASPGSGMPVTVPSNCKFVSFVFQTENYDVKKYMFTKGSTAPSSYIPYGYKIPILLNSTTINKYLGEEQTVRQIKKLVLTGQESFFADTSTLYNNTLYFGTRIGSTVFGTNRESLNSHFRTAPKGDNPQVLNYECSGFNPSSSYSDYYYMRINLDTIGVSPSVSPSAATTAFKEWLTTQYSARTPVCVWYVLATPTTGIVNEPLMKIGSYSDILTTSIPCTAGENTLDVQTTVQPSEVAATFDGWHPVQSVHERENGQWD